MELVITIHAQQRMDQYGITPEQVKTAIKRGAKFPQTEGMVAVFTYLRVAYKVVGEKYILKTVMIQR